MLKKGGENKTRVELVSSRLKEDDVNFFGQMVRMLLCWVYLYLVTSVKKEQKGAI